MKNKFYYKDGTTSSEYDYSKTLHRTDGPAAEYADGSKDWYVDGKRHRVDGPAIKFASGHKEWWLDDAFYTKKAFRKLVRDIKQLPLALKLTDPREWVRNYEN
jgi:hypothetical protein